MRKLGLTMILAVSTTALAQNEGRLVAKCVTKKSFCVTIHDGGGGHTGGGGSDIDVCSPKQSVTIYTADSTMIDSDRVLPYGSYSDTFRVKISNSGIEEEIVLNGRIRVSGPHWVGSDQEHRGVRLSFDSFYGVNEEFKNVRLTPSIEFIQYSFDHNRKLKDLGLRGNGTSIVYSGCTRGTDPGECYTHEQVGRRSSCTLFMD